MSKRVGFIISSIFSVAVIVMYFLNWIGSDVVGNRGESLVSLGFDSMDMLSGAGKIFGDLGSSGTAAMAACIVLLVLIGVSVISLLLYVLLGIIKGRGHKKWGNIGMIISFLISGIVVIAPDVLESQEGMGALIGVVLGKSTTVIPVVVMVLSILSIIFLNALDKGKEISYGGHGRGGRYDDRYDNYDNNYDNNYDDNYDDAYDDGYGSQNDYHDDFAGGAPVTPEKYCPACGRVNPDYAVFCQQCGFNFKEENDVVEEPEPYTPPQPVEPEPYTPPQPVEPEPYVSPQQETTASRNVEWHKANDLLGNRNDDNNSGDTIRINL